MHIIRRRGWEIPESEVTPETAVLGRRRLLAGSLALSIGGALGTGGLAAGSAFAEGAPAEGKFPLNPKYEPGRELSAEKDATTYNNYYEFSESKNLWRAAQALKTRPWSVEIKGMVKQPRTIAIDDLLRQVQQEERIYRHRCVERWAMTVPWTGFPVTELLRIAEPLGSAKYLVFTTLADEKVMPGISGSFYPWPYVEGVTMAEAANEMAFLSTGLFGKPLPPQNGAPLRLTLPWKYGFKSVKSIVSVEFTDKRPTTFWEQLSPQEYGFWANINPAVAHPRWSQAQETLLGSGKTVPTQIYNGYGPFVASLYDNLKSERLFT